MQSFRGAGYVMILCITEKHNHCARLWAYLEYDYDLPKTMILSHPIRIKMARFALYRAVRTL